ncbi:MAG: copper homeostasis protein CutC [Candidatus Cloacimonetes bacterium]|nr:copper homeostasis protein CutC [Candidatus Cloacimonadota bacterium]
MKHLVEICTDTLKSVENAIIGGSQRIELCSVLECGGITPSYGFTKKVAELNKIKVNILIRPRPGNFVYSDDEFKIMCEDIKQFKELNINGIVSGVLTKEGTVDIEKTKILVELSKPLEFTFHRAFDNCKNINHAIDEVIETGANRLLTSGGKASVDESKDTIIKLHKKYGNRITIMPGGGINLDNAAFFIENGIKEIHLSAGSFEKDNTYYNNELAGMGNSVKDGEIGYKYSNIEVIKGVCDL